MNLTSNAPNDERYTPPRILRLVRRVMGGIDCDPASCEAAQERVKAAVWYSREDDGRRREWCGRVWMNPPYSRALIGDFVLALLRERASGRCTEAIVLVNNATETRAVQTLLRAADCVCLITGRIAFLGEDLDGKTGGYQGQILTYHGARAAKFARVMGEIGTCWCPSSVRQAGLFDGVGA